MKKVKTIVPSAPFKNYEEIEKLAIKANGRVERVQIDVCDGKFVKAVSWPFTEFSKTNFENFGKKNDFDVYLPLWESLNYSVDLMVENPERYIETFAAYGVDQVFIHFRSIPPFGNGEWGKVFEFCNQYQLDLVLAVDVQTNMEEVAEFLNKNKNPLISGVQVMGIENIGFQGQGFAEKSLEIVKKLKKEFPNLKIYFDGGINEETIGEIKNAGVDIFCVGSFLTKSDNFEEDLDFLQQEIFS